MKEDKKLKLYLVLQSLCPLFILIFIRYAENVKLITQFFSSLFCGDSSVIEKDINSSNLGGLLIPFVCISWFIVTVFVVLGFSNWGTSNFNSHGEKIIIKHERKDSGIIFLVTYILPLLNDDVSTLQGLAYFVVLLAMLIYLFIKSDLFYQNPVLVALGYKTYEFQFDNPYSDVKSDKMYIGLSKGKLPEENVAVRRKNIAGDVFFIKNE